MYDGYMPLYAFLLLLSLLSNIVLSLVIFRFKYRSNATNWFQISLLCITVWSLAEFLSRMSVTVDNWIFWDKVGAIGWVFFPVTFLITAIYFTHRDKILSRVSDQLVLFLPAIIFLFIDWNTEYLSIRTPSLLKISAWGLTAPTAPLLSLYTLWLEANFLISIYFLVKYYQNQSNAIAKKQTALFILGTLIPLVLGSVTDLILPLVGISIVPFAIPTLTITCVLVAYAILKYHLFQINAVTVAPVIVETMNEALIGINNNFEIDFANQQAEPILGVPKNELLGKPLKNFINPRDWPSLMLNIKPGRKISTSRYSVLTKKGLMPVSLTAAPILTDQQVLEGVVVVLRDISLEKKIDQAKSEFVSLASHQLRSPLATINWYIEQLLSNKQNSLTPWQEDHLNKIYSASRKMVNLVSDLLNVSRIELGTLVVKKQNFDLTKLIQATVDEFKQLIKQKSLTFKNSIGGQSLMVKSDPQLIQIVIHNLISNAIRYTPSHGLIRLHLRPIRGKKQVLFEIADTGYGIPDAEQSKIFNKLYRAGNVKQKVPDGTGLGLYIAQSIVDKSGGKIWFKSTENSGTIFYVILPIVKHVKKTERS